MIDRPEAQRTPLMGVLHRAVAVLWVYDFVQRASGGQRVRRWLAAVVTPLHGAARVLDIGGGTGIYRNLWASTSTYICLDLDPVKLLGFRAQHHNDIALLGDATQLPIQARSVNAVFCAAVSHHIPDEALTGLVSEAMRVLTPGGQFVFFDAVWAPSRPLSRLMWRYDRGSHPRPTETLRALIGAHGTIEHWQESAVFHRYIIAVARKEADSANTANTAARAGTR